MRSWALRFSARTSTSSEPTSSSVGAVTRSMTGMARSGRPPRETTAATASPRSAAATRPAAAPVLAPKKPTGRVRTSGRSRSQAVAARTLRPSRSMSKTLPRSAASGDVSRSNSSVAQPWSTRARATATLRVLRRLLPLPWAKTTTPHAPPGTVSVPGRLTAPAVTTTSVSTAWAFMRAPPTRSIAPDTQR